MEATAEANSPRWGLMLCLSTSNGIVKIPDMTYGSRDRSAEQTLWSCKHLYW